MSIPHHEPESEAMQRLVNEIFGRAKLRWPNGQVDPTDRGETAFAIATDTEANIIRIQFSKPMVWLGLDRASAIQMRDLLTNHIEDLR